MLPAWPAADGAVPPGRVRGRAQRVPWRPSYDRAMPGPDERADAHTPAPAWTSAPTTDEARERLSAWARARRSVPDDLFGEPLRVRDVSVTMLRVTRLLEARAEHEVVTTVPPLSLPLYDRPIEQVDAGYHGWGAHRWEGLRDGSLQPVGCLACAGSGQLACVVCRGEGRLVCWPRQICRWCGGSGRARRAFGGRGRAAPLCTRCLGGGQQACFRCRGSGWRPCLVCAGGHVRCHTCTGSGLQVRSTRGEIRWWPSVEEIEYGDPRPLGPGARRRARSRGVTTEPGGLPGLPEEVGRRLDAELRRAPAGQVRAKAEVMVLLAAEVTWRDGDAERRAYLLGEDRSPYVPDARSPLRRLAWLRRRGHPLAPVARRLRLPGA